MFPKDNTPCMYPTRIPFEESTVYSRVNIKNPDLEKFPKFKVYQYLIDCFVISRNNFYLLQNTTPFIIDLNPGDVLYVPNNWWHYGKKFSHKTD